MPPAKTRPVILGLMIYTALMAGCFSNEKRKSRIRQAVHEELRVHPRATLIDLYKSFFQGAFGPGHMIPDRAAAWRYLETELQNSVTFDSVLWQPVGERQQYYRINLKLVKEGVIPAEACLEAFVQSANAAKPPALEEWRREWQMIVSVIEDMNLAISNFDEDKNLLQQKLESGEIIGHHSATFEELYHPHYRVVSQHHFEDLQKRFLLPAE